MAHDDALPASECAAAGGNMRQKYFGVVAYLKELDKEIRKGAAAVMVQVADNRVTSLREVPKQWKNKLTFRRMQKQERQTLKQLIMSEGKEEAIAIFGYVDRGTKPHRIEPKKPGGRLVFNVPYQARTAPIANANAGSGKSGDVTVFSTGVDHPGNEARLFIDYAMLEAEDEVDQRLAELFKRLS